MPSSLSTVVPLISAFLYGFAAIFLKRATGSGAGPWRVAFVANWMQALIFAPLWMQPAAPFTWLHLFHAALAGAAFFIGQVFTFLALSRGDVSVATPVLGTKVIFVALFTVALVGAPIPLKWWGAAAITAVATAMMGGGTVRRGDGTFARSLIYGFSAAAGFSLTDVFAQKWAPAWGFAHFAPAMFLTVGLLSWTLVPCFRESLFAMPAQTWQWLLPGAVLLSFQALGIAFSIMTFGEATRVNILYASRGVWAVVFIWAIGHWFGNEERSHGHTVMARRLAGSILLLFAIFLVLSD